MREGVLAGIGSRRQLRRLAITRRRTHIDRRIPFGRVCQQLDDDFQQLADTCARPGGSEHHRNQMPLAQDLLEGLV